MYYIAPLPHNLTATEFKKLDHSYIKGKPKLKVLTDVLLEYLRSRHLLGYNDEKIPVIEDLHKKDGELFHWMFQFLEAQRESKDNSFLAQILELETEDLLNLTTSVDSLAIIDDYYLNFIKTNYLHYVEFRLQRHMLSQGFYLKLSELLDSLRDNEEKYETFKFDYTKLPGLSFSDKALSIEYYVIAGIHQVKTSANLSFALAKILGFYDLYQQRLLEEKIELACAFYISAYEQQIHLHLNNEIEQEIEEEMKSENELNSEEETKDKDIDNQNSKDDNENELEI